MRPREKRIVFTEYPNQPGLLPYDSPEVKSLQHLLGRFYANAQGPIGLALNPDAEPRDILREVRQYPVILLPAVKSSTLRNLETVTGNAGHSFSALELAKATSEAIDHNKFSRMTGLVPEEHDVVLLASAEALVSSLGWTRRSELYFNRVLGRLSITKQ